MAVILKKQTIRNIASIVKADIDYEKGLVDFGTGIPSSLFLIYGDTGAGKTAILDSLSLALYKTTPRIEAVGNKTNNKFKDTNGFDVNVCGISQYTRVGISSKDECYTEVEFVDRKGRDCMARLDLGYTLTGKHRSPSWKYTVDGKEYVKDADIEDIRSECIGFDFAQYQQTCMLAQGKFDAFLTGGREERQRIMEQLTNTKRFTDYGNAIFNCFNLHKREKESADEKANNYKVLLLSAQNLEECKSERSELTAGIAVLNKTISDDEKKKDTTGKLVTALNEKANAEAKKSELNAQSESADHLANVKTVLDWDGSNDARQALNEYDKAVGEIDASQKALQQYELLFNNLDDDLLFRKESEGKLKSESQTVEQWLNDNAAKAPVYAKEGEITTKMQGVIRQTNDIADNETKLVDEQTKTPQLQQNVDVASQSFDDSKGAVDRVNGIIAQLNNEKSALHPAGITSDLTAANDRKNALEGLRKDIVERDEINETIGKKNTSLKGLKANLQTLDRECETADNEYGRIKIEAETANRIYGDVMLSKDEMLQKMREQLALDRADTCPLCGSHVADWTVNLDAMLEPLKEQKRLKDGELKAADKKRKDAIERKGKVNGEITGLEKEIAAQLSKLKKVAGKITAIVTETGLDASLDLLPQVDAAINDVVSQIALLNAKNQKVLDLDEQIKGRHAELAAAQKVLGEKERAKSTAENVLNANVTEIKRLYGEISKGRNELSIAISDINNLLVSHYGTWQNDILAAIELLKRDAGEYKSQQDLYDKLQRQLTDISTTIGTVSQTKDNILTLCPSWKHQPSAREYQSANITSDWNNLYSRVYSNIVSINKNTTTKSNSILLLDDYYAKSGNSEAILREIIAKAPVIESLRKSIDTLNRDIALQKQLISNAVKAIDNYFTELSICNISEMEPLADIEQRLMTNKEERDAKNVRMGVVENMIKTDDRNHKLYDEALKDLERKAEIFEKWKRLNDNFGKNKLCLLVQSYIMRPLLNNANVYLQRITDRYTLTFNNQNEQLSILVLDRYNQNQIRSATVLSGGERFMISLALSLALSALNRSDSNFNVLFIDEGFGTLDEKSLDSVMKTLEMLPHITGQNDRRVGIISHIEELVDRIPTQIQVVKKGDGRSDVNIKIN